MTRAMDEGALISFWIDEIDIHMVESDFQRDFFENLRDWFHKRETLSSDQKKALERIYERVTR